MNFKTLRFAATSFILTMTLIGAVACVPKQQAETTDVPTILIDNFDGNQLDPGQLLAGVEVVKLGNDSVIVGQVLDVEQMDSLLYVLDNTGNILAIDLTSKELVYRTRRIGSGPCEYQKATDLSCCHQQVNVWDAASCRVITLDARLQPVAEARILQPAVSFAAMDDDHFVFENLSRETTPYQLIRSDRSGNELQPLLPCDVPSSSYRLSSSQFRNVEGKVWYHESGSDQLLCWDDSTFSVAYKYDFTKKGHDAAEPIEPGTESAYALNTSVWKLPGYVINSFLYKGRRYYGFYDCGQRQVVAGTLTQYEGLPFYPQWATDELLIGSAGGFEDASHGIEVDDMVLLLFTLK